MISSRTQEAEHAPCSAHLQTALAAKRGIPEVGAKGKSGAKVLAVPVRGRGRGGRSGGARGATNGREHPLHPASLKITIRNDRVRSMPRAAPDSTYLIVHASLTGNSSAACGWLLLAAMALGG